MGLSVRPGSWTGAEAQDGSSGNLRDPARVHTQASRHLGSRLNTCPGPHRSSTDAGAPTRRARTSEGSCGARNSRTAVYGPVRTVVWEGRSREAPPYPDLWPDPDKPIGVRGVRCWGTTGLTHHARETMLMTRFGRTRCKDAATHLRRSALTRSPRRPAVGSTAAQRGRAPWRS
jgi:hypothetical protein